MKIILNVEQPVYRQLELLAQLRGGNPQHIAEDLLTGLTTKANKNVTADIGNLYDIMVMLASRLLLMDASGIAIHQSIGELSMLDDSP